MKIPNGIKKRIIKQRKVGYGLDSQRAELLKRNKAFLKELEGIKARLGDEFFEFYNSGISIEELREISKDNFLSMMM
ncbi:MAG: hypothetical protein WAU81_15815 [Candidatus Aminicenantales bacterium]